MENDLNIYKLTFTNVYIDSCTQKLFYKHRHIKTIRVKSCQIATFNIISYIFCYFLKSRTICHICIINPMYGRRSFRNMHFGIDTHCFRFLIPVRIYFQIANFNDPVCVDIGSRCLQIEEHNRVFQI